MALTREECEIAWNTIKDLNNYPIQCSTNETQDKFQMIPFVELFSDEIALIDNLITEHFDNPPLKFEELIEGMWVWDNEEKEYIQILTIYPNKLEGWTETTEWKTGAIETSIQGGYINDTDIKEFEEGRFFAREVKE